MTEPKNNKAVFEEIFSGLDSFLATKTVVGEPIEVDGATIIPLIDVTCGMGAGTFGNEGQKNAGGMSAKMSPCAILVIQNGTTKIINVKNQDAFTKIADMVPDIINKLTGEGKISPKAKKKAENMAEKARPSIETR